VHIAGGAAASAKDGMTIVRAEDVDERREHALSRAHDRIVAPFEARRQGP
jgi:hypothetical protein